MHEQAHFTPRECEEYLRSKDIALSRHQVLQGYMIFGGVPYYWSLLGRTTRAATLAPLSRNSVPPW